MDGDSVTSDEPSEDSDSRSLAEIFEEVFPYYLAMGMTTEEYWRGNPSLVRAYRKAYKIKLDNQEWARWRSGMYFYTTMLAVAPVLKPFTKGDVKPGDYPEEPFPITEEDVRKREEEHERRNMEHFLARMTLESDMEKQRRREQEQEVDKSGEHRQS